MYNVKVIMYPDLSRQIRVYSHPVYEGEKKKPRPSPVELDPFNDLPVRDIDEVERSILVSRKRTIDKIYMYARSNTWDWFVTFTFSPDRVNRYDYDDCSKKISKWLKNMKLRYCPDMKYIVVPELHKDGAYHFHGLFADCDGLDIRDSGKKVIRKYQKGSRTCFKKTDTPIYILGRYHLGWTTATAVRSNDRVVKYITKYISKDLVSSVKGKKRYWVSRNLDIPLEETGLLGSDERFVYQSELSEVASFEKHVECKDIKQVLSIYELKGD